MNTAAMKPDYPDRERDLDLEWWAAANYLTVAQIYLKSNPLLRQALTVEDIKPRLLGHWGCACRKPRPCWWESV